MRYYRRRVTPDLRASREGSGPMFHRITVLIVIGLGILLGFGCDDSPTVSADRSKVSGTVCAYICSQDDVANDTINPLYTVQTGRSAVVEFNRIRDGRQYSNLVLTDERSAWSVILGEGPWEVVVSSPHTLRTVVDTLTVTGDTTVEYDVRYRVADPDTLLVTFQFVLSGPGNIWDFDGPTEEEFIEILNDTLGSLLLPEDARFWVDSFPLQNALYHSYAVPVNREMVGPYLPIQELFPWAYRYGLFAPPGNFPDNMRLSWRTFPLCPFDIIIIDSNWIFPPPVDSGWGFYDDPDSGSPYDSIIYGP